MSDNRPIILIVSAASGTGKSSLTKALVKSERSTVLSVSHTTRERRRNEVDGQDYFFISSQVFQKMVATGHFAEFAKVYDHYYGTSRKTIEDNLNSGFSVVLDIDWQGAEQVARQFDCAVRVFLLPPSIMTLKKRLINRKRDSEEVIRARLEMAIDDMKHCVEFDHIVLNDQFNAALEDLRALLPGHGGKVRPLPEDLLASLGITA